MSVVYIVDIFITHFFLVQHRGKRAHLLSILGSLIPEKSCGTFLQLPVPFPFDNLAKSYRLDDFFFFFKRRVNVFRAVKGLTAKCIVYIREMFFPVVKATNLNFCHPM